MFPPSLNTPNPVQEVAKASKEVHGEVRRDGWVRARIAHREFMPVFASKKDIMKM